MTLVSTVRKVLAVSYLKTCVSAMSMTINAMLIANKNEKTKLKGAANYESHKQRRGVKFVEISPHLQKAAWFLRLPTRVVAALPLAHARIVG